MAPVIQGPSPTTMQEAYLLICVAREADSGDITQITYRAIELTYNADGLPSQVEVDNTPLTISMHEAVQAIESGHWQFYVYAGERLAAVEVVERNGRRFLRTEPDDTTLNNLNVFKEC